MCAKAANRRRRAREDVFRRGISSFPPSIVWDSEGGYAGPFVTGTSISLLAFATRGLWHGLACAIYFVVYGQLEGNILGPLIFRRTVRVNPLVVTLSVLFFGEIAGIPGVIIAVPAVAAIQTIVGELLTFHRQKNLLP